MKQTAAKWLLSNFTTEQINQTIGTEIPISNESPPQNPPVGNTPSKSMEWQPPVSFDDRELPVIDTRVFPDWLRDYIEGVAEESQTPVDASAMAAIATLSTVIAGKFVVSPRPGWTETLNTYTVMALGSANRKSAVFNRFLSPITEYERTESERLKPEIADQQSTIRAKEKRVSYLEMEYSKKGEDEKLEEAKSISKEIAEEKILSSPRFITADATPEVIADLMHKHNEKIAIMSAEGAEAFEMMAGRYSDKSNIDIYLKAHAADYVSVDRMSRNSITLHNPTMTIGLFVQPSVIQNIPFNFQNRGLTQRFLYSLPKSIVGFRKTETEMMHEEVDLRFKTNIKRLLEYKSAAGDESEEDKPNTLTFDAEAYQYMIQLEDEREVMLRDLNIPEGFRGWLGKMTGQIIRITALFHIADNVTSNLKDMPLTINKTTLERANKLRDYFISHAEAAHGVMGANECEEDARYILKCITESKNLKDKEVIDYQDLWQLAKKKLGKSQNLKDVLVVLEDMRYIKNSYDGKKSIILINPILLNPKKSTPNTPSSDSSPQLQGFERSTDEILIGTNTPSKKEEKPLGVLGTTRDSRGTGEESYSGGHVKSLGVLGADIEAYTNNPPIINKDGSEIV